MKELLWGQLTGRSQGERKSELGKETSPDNAMVPGWKKELGGPLWQQDSGERLEERQRGATDPRTAQGQPGQNLTPPVSQRME